MERTRGSMTSHAIRPLNRLPNKRKLLMICRTPLFRLPLLRPALSAGFRKPLRSALLTFAALALAAGLHAQDAAPGNAQGVTQNTAQSRNAAAAAPDEPYHGTVVEQVVARVNDQIISTSDYKHAEQELEQEASQQNWSQEKLEDARKNLLRDLIDNQLLLSKGKQLGISGEAQTVRQLDEIRKQNHLDSMEALEDAVAKQGMNFADFKASIENRVITSQVIRDQVGRRINITQPEEHAYYDAHKAEFTTPESVKLSEILIPTADADNTAQVAEARKKADDIEAQLKSGANFTALAKKDSGGSTAAQGGVLGEYTRGQLGSKELEDDTFSLDAGQYTAPIQTRQGFIILKVDAHTRETQQSFDQAENQVQEAIGMQMMQPALRSYLQQLRDEAAIQVFEHTDSAATKNEVHPVYSAYEAPHKKKKKKRELVRYGEDSHRRTRTNFGVNHKQETAAPAAPSNVPSLADIADNSAQPAASAKDAKKQKKEEARSMKPGKREKVRFGQAPRETLPTASHDADKGTTQVAGADQAQIGNAAGNTADDADTAPAPKQKKVRYSSLAFQSHAQKKKRKAADARAKLYPYENKPETAQETADQKQQDQPLGPTASKKKKPKPAEKTRYSAQAYDKADKSAKDKTPPPAAPGPDTPAAPQVTPDAVPSTPAQTPQK
jgi:peptidyl-prolyl cis-trans isomerase SurA